MVSNFLINDYIQIRSELRQYQKNQFFIQSLLITGASTVYVYSIGKDSTICLATGFIIPAIFAALGTFWFDTVFRYKHFGYYSCLIESKIEFAIKINIDKETSAGNLYTLGWEHYNRRVNEKRSQHIFIFKDRLKLPRITGFANYYYYCIFSAGVILLPLASCVYCSRQLAVTTATDISNLCYVGIWLWVIQLIISILYVMLIIKDKKQFEETLAQKEEEIKKDLEIMENGNKQPVV